MQADGLTNFPWQDPSTSDLLWKNAYARCPCHWRSGHGHTCWDPIHHHQWHCLPSFQPCWLRHFLLWILSIFIDPLRCQGLPSSLYSWCERHCLARSVQKLKPFLTWLPLRTPRLQLNLNWTDSDLSSFLKSIHLIYSLWGISWDFLKTLIRRTSTFKPKWPSFARNALSLLILIPSQHWSSHPSKPALNSHIEKVHVDPDDLLKSSSHHA